MTCTREAAFGLHPNSSRHEVVHTSAGTGRGNLPIRGCQAPNTTTGVVMGSTNRSTRIQRVRTRQQSARRSRALLRPVVLHNVGPRRAPSDGCERVTEIEMRAKRCDAGHRVRVPVRPRSAAWTQSNVPRCEIMSWLRFCRLLTQEPVCRLGKSTPTAGGPKRLSRSQAAERIRPATRSGPTTCHLAKPLLRVCSADRGSHPCLENSKGVKTRGKTGERRIPPL